MNKEIITLVYIYQWYIFIYIIYIHVYLQMKQEIITLVTIITIINFIDDIFFIWTYTEENLVSFWKIATNFTPRFTNEKSREKINFLDVVIKIKESKITPIFSESLRMVINIFIMIPVMQDTQKDQLSSAKQFEWKEYDLRKKI